MMTTTTDTSLKADQDAGLPMLGEPVKRDPVAKLLKIPPRPVPALKKPEPPPARPKKIQVPAPVRELPRPRRRRRSVWGRIAAALLFVAVPATAVGYYCYTVAADQYTATAKFSIRSQQFDGRDPTQLSAVTGFGNFALPQIQDTLIVTEYLHSQQLLEDIKDKVDLRAIYAKPETDFYARLDPKATAEDLLKFWRTAADVHYDVATGVTTVDVRAFTPEDAKAVADAMLAASETIVNDLSERARGDVVKLAESEAANARARLNEVVAQIEDFQKNQKQIDPTADAKGKVELQATLELEIATQQAKLAALLETVSPNAPTARLLRSQIESLKAELAAQKSKVSAPETAVPLGQIMGSFNKLQIEQEIATKLYSSALASLESARQQAALQNRYLVAFVRPALPTASLYPNRPYWIAVTAIAGLLAWLLSSLVYAIVREHA